MQLEASFALWFLPVIVPVGAVIWRTSERSRQRVDV